MIDHAQVGKMFVVNVNFEWHEAGKTYNDQTNKYDAFDGHWSIGVTLSDKPSRYGAQQTMTIKVEQGIGQKLAAVLMPVIIADASQKAQQLADDSKKMLAELGDRALVCLTNMPTEKP
jgi:hypothetical protein